MTGMIKTAWMYQGSVAKEEKNQKAVKNIFLP